MSRTIGEEQDSDIFAFLDKHLSDLPQDLKGLDRSTHYVTSAWASLVATVVSYD